MNSPDLQRTYMVAGVLCFVLVGACLVAYIPAMYAGYIWDDDVYVTGNPLLSAPNGLWRIWFTTDAPSQYFPMVYTTFRFEYALWGLEPFGYHLTNIILHVVNALLLWYLLSRLTVPGAWLAAAIFALHPVHTESVAWITQRKNVLSLLFYLCSALAYLQYALESWKKTDKDNSEKFYILSLILFLCSLSSKTVTCTFPAALLVVLWWKRGTIRRKDLIDLSLFFILGLVCGLYIILWERGHQGTGKIDFGLNLIERMLIASRALWFYLGKLIWPVGLAFNYPLWKINASNPFQYSWLLACLIVGWILLRWRDKLGRGPIAAIVFFVVTLSPMLGFISLYTFIYTYVTDHYQYVASIGPITLIVAASYRLIDRLDRWKKGTTMFAAVSVLMTLGTLTWHQSHIYKDLETLWRDTIQKNPNSYLAQNNLGIVLAKQGKFDESISHFRKALPLKPYQHSVYKNLGMAFFRQGKFEEAIGEFNKSLKIKADYVEAHCELGHVLLQQDKLEEAVSHFRVALQIKPDYVNVMDILALTLATTVDNKIWNPREGVKIAERACELTDYKQPEVLDTLAMAYAATGRFAEAVAVAKKAINLARAENKQQLADEIKTRLQLYKVGQSYRK